MEVMVIIKNGQIYNKSDVKQAFKLADGDWKMTIEPYRVRSLNQNDYYWSVVVPAVRSALKDVGYSEIKNDKQAHEFMKAMFLAERDISLDMLSKLEEKKLTTTTLSTLQFNGYVEDIIQWAAEYLGIVIPPPMKDPVMIASYDNEVNATIIE
ncbi:hypothetical protein QTN47_27200 [Danxiaibacter flavus]|uniref:Uncharacterized protein n=1 Tax=Danxiaibacter flavus TaxID=3049108 RepID=A0ABV3ZMW4_9BACT|nr:hypothetical protein QNM32_27200 [Chitinophagaceae bacterium DXS]